MNNYPYASMRDSFDLSAYFVVGPQDCKGRPITDVIDDAIARGCKLHPTARQRRRREGPYRHGA